MVVEDKSVSSQSQAKLELRPEAKIERVGLSQLEVAVLLQQYGYNELPSTKPHSPLAIAFNVVREPMFLLLLVCGGLYMLLGSIEEALILLGFVFVIIGITFYQERKTERALEALRDLSSPQALVIRDGKQQYVPGREVVPGDLVIVSEGGRIPADGILLEALNLWMDESLLTGESVAVSKVAEEGSEGQEMGQPGGDDLPFVYSATLVVKGRGIVRIGATGVHTKIGVIGKALDEVKTAKTALQTEVNRLIRTFAIVGIILCLVVAGVYSFTHDDLLDGILAGITLAMAVLPEEFPVILTVFLALGAWRISQKRVLTRSIPAIETLGAATVLCTDKTGTLTLNRMRVQALWANSQTYKVMPTSDPPTSDLPENFHSLVTASIFASDLEPFDPMERAFRDFGEQHLHEPDLNLPSSKAKWTLVREYPLTSDLLAMTRVWHLATTSPESAYTVAAKGAPEAIFELCRFSPTEREYLNKEVQILAAQGLRVLGVAATEWQTTHNGSTLLPDDQRGFNFAFLGLLGLADPIRPTVPAAVTECYQAGMRVIMITGDYPLTAQSIGWQVGLKDCEQVISGSELDAMSVSELQERIKTVNIFARVIPTQKLRLVEALKSNHEVVAMTGDGVNDAPALKSANIGIAMGGRGTDVAREAAALVLLDDDFSAIVEAVKSGRRIFDNLRKAMAYTLAVHIPIAGMSLLPVLFGWPLVLLPVHIVFIELIIDPACSVVFEAEVAEANVMQRPPRNSKEPIFTKATVLISLVQGFGVLIATLVVFALSYWSSEGETHARAMAFVTLILSNLGLILVNRSMTHTLFSTLHNPNTALKWVTGLALLFLGLVVYVPFLQEIFGFSQLHWDDLLICLGASIASLIWFECLKKLGWVKM
jgi:Ca2+-transporting ATPase